MTCPAHGLAVSRRFLTEADVDLIRELVGTLPAGRVQIIDLGAGSGTTAAAVYAERPDASVWTVDVDQAALDWAAAFLGNAGMGSLSWTPWRADSVATAWFWLSYCREAMIESTVDLLLVDTSHEYGHTVAELRAWLPHVRDGGYVWAHDYVGDYPGVTQAVDEAVKAGQVTTYKIAGLSWAGMKA